MALAAINLDADTENEIRISVNAGKVVTTHEQRLNYNGWIGEGYIILDPETGAGAYKIAGGGNGAEVITTTADVINWISFAAGLKVALYAVSWGPHAGLVLAAINMLTTLISLGTSCPAIFDATALASIWFFTMAMMVIGVLIATLGPMGIAASIAMALMVQGASMFLGEAFASGC